MKSLQSPPHYFDIIIVGGGIAGVSCCKTLAQNEKIRSIALLSSVAYLQAASKIKSLSQSVTSFNLENHDFSLFKSFKNVTVIHDMMTGIYPQPQSSQTHQHNGAISTASNTTYTYSKLCLCTGATPNIQFSNKVGVYGIRDANSINKLRTKISQSKSVAILGNGALSLELVYSLPSSTQIIWFIRDKFLGHTYFDPDISEFFLQSISFKAPEMPGWNSVDINPDNFKYQTNQSPPVVSESKDQNTPIKKKNQPLQNSPVQPALKVIKTNSKKAIISKSEIDIRFNKNLPKDLLPKPILVSSGSTRGHGAGTGSFINAASLGNAPGPLWCETLLKNKPISTSGGIVYPNKQDESNYYVYSGPLGERSLQDSVSKSFSHLQILPNTTLVEVVEDVKSQSRQLQLVDSKNNTHTVDCLISATGVVPNTQFLFQGKIPLAQSTDGGILVNSQFETNIKHIFAAGDCCSPHPSTFENGRFWYHKRLWTQARLMGTTVGLSLAGKLDDLYQGLYFQLFTHVTRFFGFKVVLVGAYHEDLLDSSFEEKDIRLLIRRKDNVEYIKFILYKHRLIGAVLIGQTDLEETVENLIQDEINLERFGPELLDEYFNLEDFFD